MNPNPSSSNPPPSSAPLAPGFRFHPTDEELVIYYLKRKALGRPLRVDAIAEVDLYKCEPWDLPSRSRIRSRDMEWYFFSPLDRKCASKSRTNRATSMGYWKTTGKDREVRHGGRVVGMKKTLVFHTGRAPKGDRTNWVMHEYRLEGEELANVGIPQDSYVVCRIFQKNGSGPQNGAQYGAPFVEDEWENEVGGLPVVRDGENDEINDSVKQEYLQTDDLLRNQDLGYQREIPPLLAPEFDEQDISGHPEDPVISPEEVLEDPNIIDDMIECIDEPTQQNCPAPNEVKEEISITADCSHGPAKNDGYLELNDFANSDYVSYPSSDDSAVWALRSCSTLKSLSGLDRRSNLEEVLNVEEFFSSTNRSSDQPDQLPFCPSIQDNSYIEPSDMLEPPLVGDSYSDEAAVTNMVFHDASSDDLAIAEDDIVQLNKLKYSPVASPSEIDPVDDLIAYFDTTDDNVHYDNFGSEPTSECFDSYFLDRSIFTQQVNNVNDTSSSIVPMAIEQDNTCRASSSAVLPEANDESSSKIKDLTSVSDVEGNDIGDKSVGKHLINMLGSISAPPACAAEFPAGSGKSLGPISTNHSSSSVRVTAGIIQIAELTLTGSAERWSLQKNADFGFLVSYNMTDSVSRKSFDFEPIAKMHDGAMSIVLRGGFYLFFFSAVILTLSYKVGMCIYNR
ncbi:uncharacterized protein [Typha angustifolia]|uniref:uncharacterized protein n=1 Tax=Typha angustifolia TaxID=59011 RepID=UPI003C2EF6E5